MWPHAIILSPCKNHSNVLQWPFLPCFYPPFYSEWWELHRVVSTHTVWIWIGSVLWIAPWALFEAASTQQGATRAGNRNNNGFFTAWSGCNEGREMAVFLARRGLKESKTIGSHTEGENFVVIAACQVWHFSKCPFVDLDAIHLTSDGGANVDLSISCEPNHCCKWGRGPYSSGTAIPLGVLVGQHACQTTRE